MGWDFSKLLTGKIMETIVSVMLQESNYMVLPYGYEQTHPALCQKWGRGIKRTNTLSRLRTSPDLLIYDNVEKTTKIVEIKSHITKSQKHWISNKKVQKYNKYWDDCILVEIIPMGEVFYAEYIAKLAGMNAPEMEVDLVIPDCFRPFNQIMDISSSVFETYKKKTLLIMDALREGYPFREKPTAAHFTGTG